MVGLNILWGGGGLDNSLETGVRDAFLPPQNICMLLLVVDLLVQINYFSRLLQTRSLSYFFIKNKLGSVNDRVKLFKKD